MSDILEEQPDNLLSQLAAKRSQIAENKETLIPVPGYAEDPPLLLIKYRLLEGQEIAQIGNTIRQQFKGRWDRTMYAGIDTFIRAVVGVYVDKGDGVPVPLTIQGQPVTGFTRSLAEGLQFADTLAEPDDPRQVVFALFANNEVAIAQHNFNLNRWMSDTSIDISKDMFEGNL